MTTAYLSHPDCLRHENAPGGHPESPLRFVAIADELHAAGLWGRLVHVEAPPASREQLLRAHTARHVDVLTALAPARGFRPLDADTGMNEFSLSAALHAAGAVVRAVGGVCGGEFANAFCAVRPPGHHASGDAAMGFCLFNSVAVGAAHVLAAHGLARVAVLDFDVHHGNGTADIFGNEARVLFCSTFQHPFYPYSGPDDASGHVIITPLPAGSNGAAFRAAIERDWLPALERFRPELVLVSAGFDAHGDDPLAGLALSEADYAWVTEQLTGVAARHVGGRLVSSLEGGYDPGALARSVRAHLEVLLKAEGGT